VDLDCSVKEKTTIAIVSEPKEKIAEYVLASINSTSVPSDLFRYTAIAVIKNGVIQAGILYERFTGESIEIHIGANPNKRWLTKSFLHAWFHYPFVQLGVNRITANIASKNTTAIKMAEHLGFIKEGVIREAMDGDDLIAYGMLKNECRFI
jgi:RimJ/RimL family protein N-acetyltransferase